MHAKRNLFVQFFFFWKSKKNFPFQWYKEQLKPNPSSSCIMYIGLENMWWHRPIKYLKVLYFTIKFGTLNFGHFFCLKFFKSNVLRQSNIMPIFRKRFINDVISVRDTTKNKIEEFLLKTNNFHPTIKFTPEISETETKFLDTKVYKGVKFNKDSILDVQTHFKPTEAYQYTNFYSCHPPDVTKGFIKGQASRLLRTNSSEITFEENIRNFSTRLKNRDYPATTAEKYISEVIFSDRKKAPEQRKKCV